MDKVKPEQEVEQTEKEVPTEKVNKQYKIVEVPTQMGLAFQTPEDETVSTEELLVRIANEIREIKKGIVG